MGLVTPKVVFRTDANEMIGMGHLTRCLAMAEMMTGLFQTNVAIQDDGRFESMISKIGEYTQLSSNRDLSEGELKDCVVVVDGYGFSPAYREKIFETSFRSVAIDDLHSSPQRCHAILNHSPSSLPVHYEGLVDNGTRLWLGIHYSLLRSSFLRIARDGLRSDRDGLLICLGGSDSGGVSALLLRLALESKRYASSIVLGKLNPHRDVIEKIASSHSERTKVYVDISDKEMATLMSRARFGIFPPSGISLEASAARLPFLTGLTAENQQDNYKWLVASQMAVGTGWFAHLEERSFLQSMHELESKYSSIINNQSGLVDGKSDHRLRMEMLLLCIPEADVQNNHWSMRSANDDDCSTYFRWTNDPETRRNAFNTKEIQAEEHWNWFREKLESDKTFMFVLNRNHEPVGQIRFDQIPNGHWQISYSLDSAFRGKRLSNWLVLIGCERLRQAMSEGTIVAQVKPENLASIRAFERLKFYQSHKSEIAITYTLDMTSLARSAGVEN